MYYLNFFKRLLSSLIIGGQAINFIFKGKISKNDLFDQLMESGPGSLLIVLITGIAAGTVFNIQVASQLTSMGVSSCLLYTSPSPRDPVSSRMPSSA